MDITERLRKWTFAVDAQPASDLMDEAANEIDRLRSGAVESREMVRQKSDCQLLVEYIDSSQRTLAFEQEAEIARLRLTDAEREAVEWALKEAVWSYSEDTGNHRATLRGLLDRMVGER